MLKHSFLYVLLATVFFFNFQNSINATEPQLTSVEKIWDTAPHNAFTDLIRFHDQWICVFREGKAHVSPDGAIRVISSIDGSNWKSLALITATDADLRDPKITLTPQGQLMIVGAAAMHDKSEKTHQTRVWFSDNGIKWSDSTDIGDPNFWLWRIDWHNNTGYGVGYNTGKDRNQRTIRLYETKDGKTFNTIVEKLEPLGSPGETKILFEGDQALCLLRRDAGIATGMLGISKAPFTDWKWKDLGTRIGGPNMIRIPGGQLIGVVRLYDKKARTAVCEIDEQQGTITEKLTLPSGGDTSYAGLVWHNDQLWISYYSSHEAKTSIYLAKVSIK